MRIYPVLCLLLLSFIVTSCGNSTADGSTAEESKSSVFSAAEKALAQEDNAASVRKLLIDNFSSVSDANTGALNEEASQDFVRLAQAFADKYPQDTLAALPLYRAAEVVRALNDPKKTAEIYQMVYQRYPTFSKAPEALFMLGFTYDEDLKNLTDARKIYDEFLSLYPNHSFADDTEMLLKNLGKSDEEILKELEKQAAAGANQE